MFYIFHGEDTFSQQETLAALRAKLGDAGLLDLNTTRFEGSMPFADLRQACDSVPFLAQARLVVARDALAAKPDKELLDSLAAYLPSLPETTRLFFLESRPLPPNHQILRLARSLDSGYVKLFARPEGIKLEQWIRQRVKMKQGGITSRAVRLLADNIGGELAILDNEIEKLVMYKGTDGEIEPFDVFRLSPYAAEESIFELVDALGNRDAKRSAVLLQQKFNEGADPFYLFSMFVRQFRLLLQVKELVEGGDRAPAIGRQLNLPAYVAAKLYQQSHGFGLTQLERIFEHLLEVDVGVKTGRKDMGTALNLLIASLTTDD